MADPASFERPGDEISGPTSTPASVISAGPGAGALAPAPAHGLGAPTPHVPNEATAMEVIDSIEEDFVNSVMDTSVEKIVPASQPTPVISTPKAAVGVMPAPTASPPKPVIVASTLPGANPVLQSMTAAAIPKPAPVEAELPVISSDTPAKAAAGLSITPIAPAKPAGLTISAVSLTAKEGGEVKRVVPGLKIIGLSSELKKAMPMPQDDDEMEEDAEDDEDAEDEEESNSDEEDEDESQDDDEEEEEGDDVEPPQKMVKTPKGPPGRKVMQVSTPGTGYSPPKGTPKKGAMARLEEIEPPSTGKKRGRPSRQDLMLREQERQEAIARGEPDPELKRKRRKPMKLNDVDSEEESKEERKRRKREEKEEKKRMKKLAKSEDTEDTEDEKPKKKGRKKKILNDDELAEREKERKRKYKEAREKQREKVEKRRLYLIRKREERKAQKVEEKKKHEEHMKRMVELRSQYLDDNALDGSLPPPGTPGQESGFLVDENSQSSMGSVSVTNTVKKRKAWGDVGLGELNGVHNPLANVTADNLFEYKWPLEGRHSEHYFLQEQVTEFLGVKSFKRKYPDCPRRTINMEERDFLIEMKIVNETQADLGLTAIPSTNVLDIMCQDFYERYELYLTVVNERKERSLRNYNYSSGGGNVKVEEAAKAAAEYNKRLNMERKTQRTAYFDMQTFSVQYPKTGKGKMKTLARPPPGNYPVAMIPGQFVDCYRSYSSKELKFFPLNSVTSAPPKGGLTTRDLQLGSDGSESDSGSSSSGSSSDSDSDSDSESDAEAKAQRAEKKNKQKAEKEDKKKEVKDEVVQEEAKPRKKVDEIRPLATCKHCQGNPNQNKIGVPELLLHCTKCDNSSHPTCVGLHLELLQYVTNYDWECTDCKKCMTCNDPADEDKMLFCDLCDRGFHIYCVGLSEIPGGRWHCGECSNCESCGSKTPAGDSGEKDEGMEWIFETKTGTKGDKMYSHTMCHPCHKQWKKGSFCPECNGVFGRSKHSMVANCWVCQRQHHAACVGLDKPDARFICSACQRRTQEKIIAGGRQETPARNLNQGQNFNRTPVTASYSRSGRRVTQINFANQF